MLHRQEVKARKSNKQHVQPNYRFMQQQGSLAEITLLLLVTQSYRGGLVEVVC